MPNSSKTLEEVLSEKGVVGWYVWSPNQVYTRDPSDPTRYVPVNVVTEQSENDIISAITEEGNRQIQSITSAGNQAIQELSQINTRFNNMKLMCLDALTSLRNYFQLEEIPVAVSILDNAINGINSLS